MYTFVLAKPDNSATSDFISCEKSMYSYGQPLLTMHKATSTLSTTSQHLPWRTDVLNQCLDPIQSNWSLLRSHAEIAIFSQPPLIAYKRDTNIHEMLVRSKLRQPATRTPGTTPCNQAKCGTCPFICTNTNVTDPKSQMNITKQFNCLTYTIVYIIHCTKCA